MMWVVENLQEELLTADEARMAADQHVQARSKVVQGLQVLPWASHAAGFETACPCCSLGASLSLEKTSCFTYLWNLMLSDLA